MASLIRPSFIVQIRPWRDWNSVAWLPSFGYDIVQIRPWRDWNSKKVNISSTILRFKSDRGGIEIHLWLTRKHPMGMFKSDRGGIEMCFEIFILSLGYLVQIRPWRDWNMDAKHEHSRIRKFKSDRGGIEMQYLCHRWPDSTTVQIRPWRDWNCEGCKNYCMLRMVQIRPWRDWNEPGPRTYMFKSERG